MKWIRPTSRTTRLPEVAIDDIMHNLIQAHYINNHKSFGLMLQTVRELYFLEHWNKCIRRAVYSDDDKFMTTDTTTLTDANYDRIISKVEDTVGMSIDELSHGRIFYKNQS